jgi:hypothetical protein
MPPPARAPQQRWEPSAIRAHAESWPTSTAVTPLAHDGRFSSTQVCVDSQMPPNDPYPLNLMSPPEDGRKAGGRVLRLSFDRPARQIEYDPTKTTAKELEKNM